MMTGILKGEMVAPIGRQWHFAVPLSRGPSIAQAEVTGRCLQDLPRKKP